MLVMLIVPRILGCMIRISQYVLWTARSVLPDLDVHKYFNPFPNMAWLLRDSSTSLLKT